MDVFRNHLPLTKSSLAQEENSAKNPLPSPSSQHRGEASLQVNGEGRSLGPPEALSCIKASF